MKGIWLATLVALTATEASAISRYQTMRMSCDDVRAAVQDEGAVILRWSSKRDPSLPIYGRYVANSRFCHFDEVATYATVPTRDRKACVVNKCVMREPSDRFGRRRLLWPNW
jgi:hypothetical protein